MDQHQSSSTPTPSVHFEMSSPCTELHAALLGFRADVPPLKKNQANTHFNSRFADLAELLETIQPSATKHNLIIVQAPVGECNGHIRVVTIIAHTSGQQIRTEILMPLAQRTPQGVGSAITYARRYALLALLNLAAEDDDGELGSREPQSNDRPRPDRRARKTEPAPQTESSARMNDHDEPGLVRPSHPCPIVTKAGRNEGKRWSELPGPLIEKMLAEGGERMTEPQREWCRYLIERRRLRKMREEQGSGAAQETSP